MKFIHAFFVTATAAVAILDDTLAANYRRELESRATLPRLVVAALPTGIDDIRASSGDGSDGSVDGSDAPSAIISSPPELTTASTSCTPNSVCVDGITCSHRYGGCYDANFCTGTTSYVVPTYDCDPAKDLSRARSGSTPGEA